MEIEPSYKELIRTMEFEPYEPKYIDRNDYGDDSSVENKWFFEDLKIGADDEMDEVEDFEFEIDEEAFRCSNGVSKSENDLETDVKIDLKDFSVDYHVCNNILAIFGTKKLSTKNISSQNEDINNPPATTDVRSGGREYKSFCRPILLPDNSDTEKIYTEVIDGLTHIKIPKHSNNLKDNLLVRFIYLFGRNVLYNSQEFGDGIFRKQDFVQCVDGKNVLASIFLDFLNYEETQRLVRT